MPVIYFDNFRGFQTTFLELKQVNFLIGENSSGKTSLLKLIAIMFSRGFWRYKEFGSEDINLGGFADIKTTNGPKEYFEIGLLTDNHSICVRLRFIEEDNFPLLKEISYKEGDLNIQVIIEGK